MDAVNFITEGNITGLDADRVLEKAVYVGSLSDIKEEFGVLFSISANCTTNKSISRDGSEQKISFRSRISINGKAYQSE